MRDGHRRDLPATPRLFGEADVDIDAGPGLVACHHFGGEHLARPLAEMIEVDAAAAQAHACHGDLPDEAEADEDLAALHGRDQPQRARWIAADGRQDHDVADPADGRSSLSSSGRPFSREVNIWASVMV